MGAALPQEIPAAVELDLHVGKAGVAVRVEAMVGRSLVQQPVFLGDELVDVVQDVCIVHALDATPAAPLGSRAMIRPARHLPAALLLTLTALGLGACGSGDGNGATTTAKTTAAATPAKGRYSDRQVAKLAGFTQNADGKTWTNPTGCRVTMILPTHAEILKYRTSPDALVVSNSADDVGVVFDLKSGCREALLANLSQVK